MRTLFQDYESFFGQVDIPGTAGVYKNGKPKPPKKLNLSLKNQKISYTDYVRHPEFEVLGVSLRWEDEPAARFYRKDQIASVYAGIDWSNVRIVSHNALFEGLVNREIFGIVPAEYFCTLAAAEAIYQGAIGSVSLDNVAKVLGVGEKLPDLASFKGLHARDLTEEQWAVLARYANNDVDLTVPIYEMFSAALPEKERALMSKTIMLFADPVLRVDVPLAQEALGEAIEARDELVAKTGLTREDISGNISFREALRGRLGWVPQKVNDKGEVVDAFAKTDLEFVKLKSHPDEAVRNLVLARMEVKSAQGINRAQRLLQIGTTGNQLFPICLHYARAHTMRWTGGNKMNPQNFERGSKLRRSILAPDGHVLLVVDSAQIECRTTAWLAGQEDLLELFRTGGDPYNNMAAKVFGGGPYDKKSDERFMGKTMVLGLGYGMGWRKFYNEIVTGARGKALPISESFAQRAVAIYRDSNRNVTALWKTCELFLEYLVNGTEPIDAADVAERAGAKFPRGVAILDPKNKKVIFPNGCFLRFSQLCCDEGEYKYWTYSDGKFKWVKLYGGKFVENIVQAIARHVVAEQILKLAEYYRPVLFVHDETVNLVPEAEAEKALELGTSIFRENLSWTDIPLDSEGGYDVCYSK